MRGYMRYIALFPCCLVAAVHAQDMVQLHPCRNDIQYIDIMGVERLPFSGSGKNYEFKFPAGTNSVTIDETKRQSKIAEQISVILKGLKGKYEIQKESTMCASYTQKYTRSNIKIVAYDSKHTVISSRTFVAGPMEHWYLSADMPISNIKQLTYDSSTNSVIEKEKPATFYLGVNWKVGDIFSDYSGSESYKNLSLKIMLKASGKPSESYGLGLAYSFDMVDVFVARLRTKDDPNINSASLGYTDTTVFGVSFNVTKGLEWLAN